MDPIAVGRTAEIHAWADGAVVKLLRAGFPEAMIEHEARVAELVTRSGMPAPRFLGRATLDGRPGIIFERIDAPTMIEALAAQPWRLGAFARQLARLHAEIHAVSGDGLDAHAAALERDLERAQPWVTPTAVTAVQRLLSTLPPGGSLLHGDLHPGNVLMSERGPMVIDWLTAARGNPTADVARSLFLIAGSALPPEMPRWQRAGASVVRRRFAHSYLAAYRRQRPLDERELAGWRLIILACRIGEGIDAERPQLVEAVERMARHRS